LAHAPWPAVRIRTSPPSDKLAVNFPVWLSLGGAWQPVTAHAAAGGVSVTVSARPMRVRWRMGDGHTIVCDGPGRAYDASLSWQQNLARRTCGYTYRRSSASEPSGEFAVTATVGYAVSWQVSGASGGGTLGNRGRSASTTVSVGQIKTFPNGGSNG
jgi:hypothetical protein